MTDGEIIARRLDGIKGVVSEIEIGVAMAIGASAIGRGEDLPLARTNLHHQIGALFDQLAALARFIARSEGEVEGADRD